MAYGNEFSNKPFERASKTSHTNIINDVIVKSFLSRCHLPRYAEEVDDQDIQEVMMEDPDYNPIKTIITIDGGYTNVAVREEFPSAMIAFIQFGVLFFEVKDLMGLKEKPFIDPEDMAKLQNIQRLKLVIPTRGITVDDEIDFSSSVRRSIYDFFMTQPEKNGFMEALSWLLFEEYTGHNGEWHLASCPYHCDLVGGIRIRKEDLSDKFTVKCPCCGRILYLTDALRLHEIIDNELGAGGILGYLTTSIEQIIVAYLIKQILSIKPDLLSQTLFVKDGPLAFFGQTANIHKPMRKLMSYLNARYKIFLVGLEKSGPFVEHAAQISQKMKPRQALLLGNRYIYKYIIPGYAIEDKPYASSSYYGNKLIYKSEYENVYVATIPSLEAKVEPCFEDYLNIQEVLFNVAALKCDLYYNSLVPVVLANKLVSLADHPSSDLLKAFAKESMR